MKTLSHISVGSLLFVLCYISLPSQCQEQEEVKCLVCHSVIDEILANITKVKPNLKASAGGYQLDNDGNMHSKQVPYSHSTVYLSELMDNVCNVLEDYVKVTDKMSGDLSIMPLVINGKMNPRMQEVDVVQDPDLNKSIKYYCEDIISENEDLLIDFIQIQTKMSDIKYKLCTQEAGYCKGGMDRDEL